MLKHRIIYNSASNWRFDLEKARGVYLWDSKGKKYLDFTSGWNVTNLGWNNPEITKAVIQQAKKNSYAPMETADLIQVSLAKILTDSLPKGLVAVGRTTGGMESNEEAIKTARAYTGRKKILGFRHMYHGQSFAMLAISFDKEDYKSFSPLLPGIKSIEFPAIFKSQKSDKELLQEFEIRLDKELSSEDYAALMTEAGIITGWGSTYVAPKGFTKLLRKLTKKYGTLLIIDEVGTGFSRCGELYGMNIENVTPDIATFAKGFSNGAGAIGAMVTTKEIAEKTWELTNLQSTFGWNPVACAAAKRNLEIHLKEKIWERSESEGKYIRDVLTDKLIDLDYIGDVRGYGMEIGLMFVTQGTRKPDPKLAMKAADQMIANGLYVLYGDDGNIQLMPPLIMERKDIDHGLEIIVQVVKGLQG